MHTVSSALANWNDIRLFLAVARAGSMVGAARLARTDQSTISRRINALQEKLGAKLFKRYSKGMRLTETDKLVFSFAETMEESAIDIERSSASVDGEMRGIVTISTTEGLGAYWLAPKLISVQRQYPGLIINLDTTKIARDLSRHEADIAIRFNDPGAETNVARHVGRLQMRPFATQGYLRETDRPESKTELRHHVFCHFDEPPVGPLWSEWNAILENSRGVVYRSGSSNAVRLAVSEGFGIGLLPIYVADMDSRLVELPIDVGEPLDIYVVTHADRRASRRVRITLNHIYRMFDLDRHKYFAG